MTVLAHVADRVLNRPLLITPDKAQVILSVLSGRIGISSPEASRFEGDPYRRDANGQPIGINPYRVAGGVAIVTITGSLVNRGAWIGASSGLTSYEGIQHQLKAAASDPAVHSVILDLASPGGEATGAMETAGFVRELAKSKRTIALVNGMACSAAYAIASGASEIVTTETGVSGSIGVVLLHADFSRQLAEEGVTPTLIFAGAHKVDGNPFEPLPESVRSDLQAEVDAFYGAFTAAVGKGRGSRLTAKRAAATEARTFIGPAAVAAGIADRLGTFETVLVELQRAASTQSGKANPRRRNMENETGAGASAADQGPSRSEREAAIASARADGVKAGRAEGIADVAAVLGAEGIAGNAARMSAAVEFLAEGLSAEKATAFATKHVADTASAGQAHNRSGGPGAHLTERASVPDSLAAAGIGAGHQQKSTAALSEAVARTNKRR
ncbi:MAG: S49 family peptidase [Pseudomonadota bacterium]|nr:S49 family peptidase [Pseudomonadota bacterium]